MLSTTAIRYSSKPHTINKFPVTLRIVFPPGADEPSYFDFKSFRSITNFLKPRRLLVNTTTKEAILPHQVREIDPGILYDMVDLDYPFYPRDSGRLTKQGVDRFFDGRSAFVLRRGLEKEDPGVVQLSSVIKDTNGRDVDEWEAVFLLSDGCIVFLEAKYRISKASQSIEYCHNFIY
jgi:hypothetical protein